MCVLKRLLRRIAGPGVTDGQVRIDLGLRGTDRDESGRHGGHMFVCRTDWYVREPQKPLVDLVEELTRWRNLVGLIGPVCIHCRRTPELGGPSCPMNPVG